MIAIPMGLSEKAKFAQRQSLDLDAKIIMTKLRIRQWYEAHDGDVYVAWSAGRDSTTLLNIVWSMYPDVPAVFSDTGLELKDIKRFMRRVKNEGLNSVVDGQRITRCGEVIIVKPKKSFERVIKEDGFAVVSKTVAREVRILTVEKYNPNWAQTKRLYDTGVKKNGDFNKASMLPNKYRYLTRADIKVSELCCDHLKKEPLDTYAKKTGFKSIQGIMAAEGGQRGKNVVCNAFDAKKPRSAPMLFWTPEDVTEYIARFDLSISDAYKWVTNKKGRLVEPEQRTGCAFCMFGLAFEKGLNRFQRLYHRDYRMWKHAIFQLGLHKPLDLMGISYLPPDADPADVPSENNTLNAYVTNKKQVAATENKLIAAVKQMRADGEKTTVTTVAKKINMSLPTVNRHKHLLINRKTGDSTGLIAA